ncbi:MAG: AAA family ATPase, partial [Candidatus Methanomethylophilaceae archaeon]|nr:AAA family ATPase [Candidatus Methanomethylophilaceae archaeon]
MSDSLTLKVAMATSLSESGFGRARIDARSREALGVSLGDAVEIMGKNKVVARVFKCSPSEEGKGLICIDGITRVSAGVSVGDSVTIRRCETSKARKVVLSPDSQGRGQVPIGEWSDRIFLSMMLNGLIGRVLVSDTEVMVSNLGLGGKGVFFRILSTDPGGAVIVTANTELDVVLSNKTKEVRKEHVKGRTTYDDVGGLGDELGRIREVIELPLKHPELFERLGIDAPKGVLLHGPTGTGKTLIAQAVANESGARFFPIKGPEIIGTYRGESEGRLRSVFESATKNAPSIVFIDEIDSIAPDRDSVSGEGERRLVAQLLTLMDGLDRRGNVIVIGATNRVDAIDPALRRPGRFDREIEIGVPGRTGRSEILAVHTRDMPLADDVDL